MLVHVEPGSDLDRLETERTFTAGLPRDAVRAFRMRMQQLRAFTCATDLKNSRALDARRARSPTAHSVRLTDSWRMNLRVLQTPDGLRVDVLEVVESTLKKTRRPR